MSEDKIKISIIVPVYNVEKFIFECLDSVALQTMTEGLECIIVDDCGTDNSIVLAQNFVDNYKGNIRFSIIHHQQNGGLSAARNTGIRAASGEYVYFLDSDDKIIPEFMKLMCSLFEKYGKVDLVQGTFYGNEEEKNKLSPHDFPEFSADRRRIKHFLLSFNGDTVSAAIKLIKRELIYKHNLWFKEGIIHEDNHWTFFVSKYINSMAFCRIPTYYYRSNPISITNNINIEKKYTAFSTILEDCGSNIDPFMAGRQKELLLTTLLCALDNRFYQDETQKAHLIRLFLKTNNALEVLLFNIYQHIPTGWIRDKVLHLLIRLYKIKD